MLLQFVFFRLVVVCDLETGIRLLVVVVFFSFRG